jgi:hypothetical protein
MIGWRPYLLTGLALVLFAIVALDVRAAGRDAPVCAKADALRKAGYLTAAERAYAAISRDDGPTQCADDGREQAENDECARAQQIRAGDAKAARALLVRLAATDPRPLDHSCIWTELAQ